MNIRLAIPLLVAAAVLAGCNAPSDSRTDAGPKSNPTVSEMALADLGYAVANPIDQGNVKLIPIVSNRQATQPSQDVVTLIIAKKNGWVEITESESAEFNAVHVKNTGPKPLLLIAGDLVTGGHQDRVIAHDTIIQPGEEKDVEVFCVEEERSTGPTNIFEPSDQPVPHKVRREAIFAASQDRVWSSVGSFNASASAAPATKTVQGGLRSEQVVEHVETNFQPVIERLLGVKNVVGYVLVIDGKIDSAEMFGSNGLFKFAAPQLVKSILAQQATNIAPAKRAMDADEVARFLVAAMTGRRDAASPVNGRWTNNAQPLQRSGQSVQSGSSTTRPREFLRVSGDDSIRGFELYDGANAEKKSAGSLLHGTYSRE